MPATVLGGGFICCYVVVFYLCGNLDYVFCMLMQFVLLFGFTLWGLITGCVCWLHDGFVVFSCLWVCAWVGLLCRLL